jgi:Zn-dependent alcohol dehydrogenase
MPPATLSTAALDAMLLAALASDSARMQVAEQHCNNIRMTVPATDMSQVMCGVQTTVGSGTTTTG